MSEKRTIRIIRFWSIVCRVDRDSDECPEKAGQKNGEKAGGSSKSASRTCHDAQWTYLFQNCGSRMMPGIITKAGNVIRLKVPKTSKKAKTKLEESEAF